jgi:hypothetical protein
MRRRLHTQRLFWRTLLARQGKVFLTFLVCLGWTAWIASAQTGGQGGLQGTVVDQTGAVIRAASVTAINQASGTARTQKTTSAGLYQIAPLTPGIYTVEIKINGFRTLRQENIEVNGLTVTGYNATLTVGSADESITVTTAPPQLQTTNSVLGSTITNETYENLPVVMSGLQRDPTALATLAPGTQSGTRSPVMSGTGDYLAEVYLDGIPTTTINMQGDNRLVSLEIPVESVDQLQVMSGNSTAEYQGAGAMSLTTKSGGSKYHGEIVDLIRNTAFDSWGFTAPWTTKTVVVNGVSSTVQADKPVEHQNELSISAGGPIPSVLPFWNIKKKAFFFVNYDKYHGRSGGSPTLFTIPTTLMRTGDFSELGTGSYLYNPLTNTCTSTSCSRTAFAGNVIPSNYISSISKYEQSFMPTPSLSGITLNYLHGGDGGYDNHELSFKIDYDLTDRQRYSFHYSHGVRDNQGLFGVSLPLPYTTGTNNQVIPTTMIFEHQYILSSQIVNQFKYGFTRQGGQTLAPTAGGSWATDAGIGGLPAGQASENFPCSSFGTTTAFPKAAYSWTQCGASDASSKTVPNAFTIVDNLQWSKGKHALTFGFQLQWLQDNVSSQSTHSGIYTQSWAGISTSQYVGTSLNSAATGYSYASFLLGAVNSAGTSVPTYSMLGGRYLPFSPYIQDDWKVTPNLTFNIGLRWDYLPPFHEVADRWSFFDATTNNSITNTPGQLRFAGNRGADISSMSRTPAQTYWKNIGPRIGMAWSVNPKTVIHAGFSVSYSHGGGVGGRAYAGTGASQLGFGSPIVLPTASNTGVGAGPSFYLNDSTAFAAAGVSNTNFGGSSYVIPDPLTPAASSLTLNIGNYVNSSGSYVTPGAAPKYVDPYLSGRAPEFEFFNFGIQRALTKDITFTINYSGSESHFIDGAGQTGFWSGLIDPAHVAQLGSTLATDGATNIMNAQATTKNIAIAQAADSSISVDSWYAAAGAKSTTPTIGRWLRPHPQYSSPASPAWDNIGNVNYHSLQITLAQREWKGVSYTLNYTYSKGIGDDGDTRHSFPVPAEASSNGKAIPGKNRADRDLTDIDRPQNLNLYGYGKLPFGKGHLGGGNRLLSNIIGDWTAAGVFTYISGTPIEITASGCTMPSAGTCFPDVVPGMEKKIRQNGGWGKGVSGGNLASVRFLNPAAFTLPNAFPLPTCTLATQAKCDARVAITKVGDAPRHGLNLWTPSKYNINMSMSRTFKVTPDRVRFVFRADCTNITNKVTFGGINTTWSAASTSTFGYVTSAGGTRSFQFSGRIKF